MCQNYSKLPAPWSLGQRTYHTIPFYGIISASNMAAPRSSFIISPYKYFWRIWYQQWEEEGPFLLAGNSMNSFLMEYSFSQKGRICSGFEHGRLQHGGPEDLHDVVGLWEVWSTPICGENWQLCHDKTVSAKAFESVETAGKPRAYSLTSPPSTLPLGPAACPRVPYMWNIL